MQLIGLLCSRLNTHFHTFGQVDTTLQYSLSFSEGSDEASIYSLCLQYHRDPNRGCANHLRWRLASNECSLIDMVQDYDEEAWHSVPALLMLTLLILVIH